MMTNMPVRWMLPTRLRSARLAGPYDAADGDRRSSCHRRSTTLKSKKKSHFNSEPLQLLGCLRSLVVPMEIADHRVTSN
jgi:hypothetical protein